MSDSSIQAVSVSSTVNNFLPHCPEAAVVDIYMLTFIVLLMQILTFNANKLHLG